MDKSTRDSQQNYDRIAASYDESLDGSYTRFFKEELARIVRLCEGNSILDVACGNGGLLALICDTTKAAGYGLDISPNMVREAGRLHPSMSFAVGNSSALPYADGVFDAVTVSCAFHHFSEPALFISESFRVLKSGGTLYIADPHFPPVIREICNLVFPLLRMGDVKIYNRRELSRFLLKAGFVDVSVRNLAGRGLLACGRNANGRETSSGLNH